MIKYSGLLFVTVFMIGMVAGLSTETKAEVLTGEITGWLETRGPVFNFDEHVNVETHIEAWWSIGHIGNGDPDDPDYGFFYVYNDTTKIALTDATSISDITDASTYTYSNGDVGPVYEGDIVVFHNVDTDYYSAFLVIDIYGSWTGIDAKVDIIW